MEYELDRQQAYMLLRKRELQGLWYSKVVYDEENNMQRITLNEASLRDPRQTLYMVRGLLEVFDDKTIKELAYEKTQG